jgi:hypothetical protein
MDCPNEYIRTLNMSMEECHALREGTLDLDEEERRFPKRRTAEGQPAVKDIVKPGDIVISTFQGGQPERIQTGPYRVESVNVHPSYVGDPVFSLVCSGPDGIYNKDGTPHKDNRYWLNGLVAVDGRVLGYFIADDSDVTVIDGTKAKGTQLRLI